MKAWRTEKDPWKQAEVLEMAEGIRERLKWNTRKLNHELERAGSEERFKDQVIAEIKALDKPRLLHRDPSKPPTHSPALAAQGEPEMVPETFEAELVKENNTKDYDRRQARNVWRKKLTLEERLHLAIRQSEKQGIPIKSQVGAITRQVERMENRLDRV